MSQFAGSRFGQDSSPRIATSTALLMESSELAPVPMYQPLVPFYPPSITSGSSASAGGLLAASVTQGGEASWKAYPDRLDLYCWQGDDVQVPLYFSDPSDPDLDMSNENNWEWKAQTRFYHRYTAPLINEFTIESEFIPADVDLDTPSSTLVTLFLPRFFNQKIGVFAWDLHSTSPFVGPDFPQPDGVADENWPMETQVKTWLYGRLYVVPRVTTTDWTPMPAGGVSNGNQVIVTPAGWLVGPNGRVP